MAFTGDCPLPTNMCDDSHVISLLYAASASESVTHPLVPFSSKVVDFVFLPCKPAQKGGQSKPFICQSEICWCISVIILVTYSEKLLLAVLTESELVLLNCKFGGPFVCDIDGKTMYRYVNVCGLSNVFGLTPSFIVIHVHYNCYSNSAHVHLHDAINTSLQSNVQLYNYAYHVKNVYFQCYN